MPLKFGAKVRLNNGILKLSRLFNIQLTYVTVSYQSKFHSYYTITLLLSYYLCMMNIQTVIVALLFAAAIFYVGRMLYKSLFVKKGCGSNCKCGVDFSAIDADRSIKQ